MFANIVMLKQQETLQSVTTKEKLFQLTGGSKEHDLLFLDFSKFTKIDFKNLQVSNPNAEEMFNFLIKNDVLDRSFNKETFNSLFDLANSLLNSPVKNVKELNAELQRALNIKGGGRVNQAFLLLLIAILVALTDPFIDPGIIRPPHHQAMLEMINNIIKTAKNNGSKKPGSTLGLSAASSDAESSDNSKYATDAQIQQFYKNDQLDVELCYKEALRRAKKVGHPNFEAQCPIERFEQLGTEHRGFEHKNAREAISIAQIEASGDFKEVKRCDIGTNISGPDFKGKRRDGSEVFFEVKNPVRLRFEGKETIEEMAFRIGATGARQQNTWLRQNVDNLDENLRRNVDPKKLPENPKDFYIVIDLMDVAPEFRESFMDSANKGAENAANSIIFINKKT